MRYFVLFLLIILSALTFFQRPKKNVSVVAKNLDTPWAIAFLPASPAGGPNGNILVTQRNGTLSEIDISSGEKLIEIKLPQVKETGEGGLLGLAIDPEFVKNNFIYLYYTYDGGNRVSKFVYKNANLSDEEILIDKIPGAPNHNGGRMKFGPDKNLYVTTGDAGQESSAQNLGSFAGKILRVAGDNIEVYSYGHRNPQGLAWDKDGQLWATEHGPSGAQTGNDELNKIDQGKNYGWPEIRGKETRQGMESPVIESGEGNTWAPAGIAFYNDFLYFAGLRGSVLYQYEIKTGRLTEHYKNEFGRIRDVVLGLDNMLYVTTSNLDGRGNPKEGDDKIIRISI